MYKTEEGRTCCVCARAHMRAYVCACTCECVCKGGYEGELAGPRTRQRKEGHAVCVRAHVCACTCECVRKGGYHGELAGPRASREQGVSPPLTEQTHNTPHPIPALRPGEPQHRLGAWRKGKPTWPMGPGARASVCLMEVPKHGRSVQRGWNWGWGGQGRV